MVTTTVEAVEEVVAAADPEAIPPALETVEANPAASMVSAPIRHIEALVGSSVDVSPLSDDVISTIDAVADETAQAVTEGVIDDLLTASLVDHRLTDISPTTAPSAELTDPQAPNHASEPIAVHEPSRPALGASMAQRAPSAPIAPIAQSGPFDTQLPSTTIAKSPADPRQTAQTTEPATSLAMSTAPIANRGAVLGPAQSLRLVDDRATRRSLTGPLGPGRSAFTPPTLLLAPGEAPVLDAPRSNPPPEPAPVETLAPPDASAPPAPSPSSLLVGSGGPPGAASPLQLSLLLLTAWRTLRRQETSHPASIALPSLAPPG
jgi:hypothetical protein